MAGLRERAIKINHCGFVPCSKKTFVITNPQSDSFTIEKVVDAKWNVVYQGKLKKVEKEDEKGYIGDFSDLCDEGDYVIRCGEDISRYFVISRSVYESAVRAMLSYFTWQRCGSELGWAGKCHEDDGYIKEGGHVDLHGGYHQSCDLRKSPAGVSIGVLGMVRYAFINDTGWGKAGLADEIRWACDYYVRSVQADGRMYNTLNAPFGWTGRTFYKSAAPASAQWCVTSILALSSKLIKERADELLKTALRSWEYLTSDERPDGIYAHPDPSPYGMDPDYFYSAIYKDSTADIAYRACAAADFYRVTEDEKWLDELKNAAEKLLGRIEDGMFFVDEAKEMLLCNKGSYAWLHGAHFALLNAAELLKDFDIYPFCMSALSEAAENVKELADKTLYSLPPVIYTEKDLLQPSNHHRQGEKPKVKRDMLGKLYIYKEEYFHEFSEAFKTNYSLFYGVFFRKASKLLNRPELLDYAQYIADYMLGRNPMDSSHVEGIGYNQIMRGVFGQFFPSTPQIPGGVNVGYKSTALHAEYDMPCVGMAMWLLGDIMGR